MRTGQRLKRAFALGSAIVMIGTIAACGGDDDDSSGGSEVSTSTPASASSVPETAGTTETTSATSTGDTTAETTGTTEETSPGTASDTTDDAPAANIDRTATLDFAAAIAPTQFDPMKARSVIDYTWLFLVYDSLLQIKPGPVLEPNLATSYEFSEDGTQLTMTLRTDVTFKDGTPFDASVVVANIERNKSNPESVQTVALAAVQSVEAVDESTVVFTVDPATAAALPSELAAAAGMMVNPAAFDDPDLAVNPAGTGAFTLREGSYTPNVGATFDRDENWWGPDDEFQVGTIVFTGTADPAAALNALQTGQADIATAGSTVREEADDLVASGDYYTVSYEIMSYGMWLNGQTELLRDKNVRQAMMYAIDRVGISETLLEGVCAATAQPFPEGHPAFVEDLVGYYDFDPDKSRSLLEEAGYDEITLKGVVDANSPDQQAHAVALQAMLADVGITVELESRPFTDIIGSFMGGEFDVVLGPIANSLDPATNLLKFINATSTAPFGSPSDVVEEAAVDIRNAALSEEERIAELKKTVTALVEEAAWGFTCLATSNHMASTQVIGLEDNAWGPYGGTLDFRTLALLAED